MPDLPPLVLLHAFPLDSRLFDPVRPALDAAMQGPEATDHPGPARLRHRTAARRPAAAAGPRSATPRTSSRPTWTHAASTGPSSAACRSAATSRWRSPADTRTGSPGWCSPTPAAAPTTTPRVERRRAIAARADAGDIAAGRDAIAPLVAAGGVAATSDARLAEIAGAVPAGDRRVGAAGDGRAAGFHRSCSPGLPRPGAGRGGGAGRDHAARGGAGDGRAVEPEAGRWTTRAARRRAPDPRRGPRRVRWRAVLGWLAPAVLTQGRHRRALWQAG